MIDLLKLGIGNTRITRDAGVALLVRGRLLIGLRQSFGEPRRGLRQCLGPLPDCDQVVAFGRGP